MAKYSKSSQKTVGNAMSRMKKGKLKSGTGAKVKNPKQAIAIGLSEARKKGAKVPPKKGAGKKAAKKAGARKKAAPKKAARKAASKKSAPKKAASKKSAATRKKAAPRKRARAK